MFRTRLITTAVAGVAALTVGGSLTSAATAAEKPRPLPTHIFAPYFQAYTSDSPAALSKASGAKFLTLAFLQTQTDPNTGLPAGDPCTILWNGDPTTPVAWSHYGKDIATIRAHGGDVIPSFGGYSADTDANGNSDPTNLTEIADRCTDVNKIAAAYEKVVTTYNVSRLDMDVESDSLAAHPAGVDRRNKAIAKVEAWAAQNHRVVQFVYTLPTNVSGLDPTGVQLLQNAVANNARVDIVNIMTFDYYDDAAHEMGADTETAAAHLFNVLHKLYPQKPAYWLWRMMGITEMVGRDDYGSGGETGPAEIFTIQDAYKLMDWASDHHIAEISFWALGRDNGNCPGQPGQDNCSGIAQKSWQFSHILEPFVITGHTGDGDGDDRH